MSQTPQDRPPYAPPVSDAGPPGAYAGQPGTPMPAYTHPAPGAAAAGSTAAVVAFVLGIFSVAGIPFLGPVAWILAVRALRDIDRVGPAEGSNRGLAVAAKVLGIIGTVLLVLAAVGVAVFIVFVVAAASDGSTAAR